MGCRYGSWGNDRQRRRLHRYIMYERFRVLGEKVRCGCRGGGEKVREISCKRSLAKQDGMAWHKIIGADVV